jgi:hypothetical protein
LVNNIIVYSYYKNKYNMIIILISLVFILGLVTINPANAFIQVVRIHVDKAGSLIGTYQTLLKNLDSGAPPITQTWYGTPGSSSSTADSTYRIEALDGDKLQGCVGQTATGEIVCDFKSANSDPSQPLDFYLNWADRITP